MRYIWFLTLVSVRVAFAQPLSLSRSTFVNRSNQLHQAVAWPYLLRTHNFIPPKKNKAQLLHEAMSTHATVQRSWLSSMVVPGLGQIYNKHYWKIPFFYLGFLLGGIKIRAEHNEMHKHERNKLEIDKQDGNGISKSSTASSSLPSKGFTERRIAECKRARNLFILITAVWYILNILDAYVGAHGRTVNFQDDIKIEPSTAATVAPAVLATASAYSSAATIPLVTFSFPIHLKKGVL
ncbi:DUF5683 domain-containing protein [Candidatus Cardinium hertigii]|uniref:DUF5683 domain-containing protein n=1 Tax=Candidatus Cardinium hertigii TaxID=247481 RepID=UPI0013A55274|nr:DUF5683 domain-containing protein [Candidatus Cardinium hertigii]